MDGGKDRGSTSMIDSAPRGRSKLAKNVLANYGGTAVIMALPLLCLPVYVRAFDAETWGLVGLVSTVLSLTAVLDGGLGQALLRTVSEQLACLSKKDRSILKGLQTVYFALGASLGMLALIGGLLWLTLGAQRESGLHSSALIIAIVVCAFMLTLQLPAAFYRTILIASGDHAALNLQLAYTALVRHGGGSLVAWQLESINVYLIWLGGTAALELYTRRRLVSRIKEGSDSAPADFQSALRLLRQTFGVSASVIIGATALQLDKLIAAHLLPLAEFGNYSVAVAIAMTIPQLATPITTALMPRLLELSRGDRERLRSIVLRSSITCAFLGLIVAIAYRAYGPTLTPAALGPRGAEIDIALQTLLIGSLLNIPYQFGYARWVADGHSRPIFLANITGLVAAITITPAAIHLFGISGAGAGWISLNVVGATMAIATNIKSEK